MTDANLEREIESAKRAFDEAIGDPPALLLAWQRLSGLVEQRRIAEGEDIPNA